MSTAVFKAATQKLPAISAPALDAILFGAAIFARTCQFELLPLIAISAIALLNRILARHWAKYAPQHMPDSPEFAIAAAERPADISSVRELLLEYWESRKLEFTYFNFNREIANLPGDYAPPAGKLLIASCKGEPAGCVALRRFDREICEMKRMYLREKFRGRGFGRALADAIIAEARRIGYRKMRLDTIGPTMREALNMYRRIGFQEIPPYRHNPLPGAAFLEIDL